MWAELYERAAFTTRADLVATLSRLDSLAIYGTGGLREVWAELGFATRFPGGMRARDRIRRRILDRHDTYVRVQL